MGGALSKAVSVRFGNTDVRGSPHKHSLAMSFGVFFGGVYFRDRETQTVFARRGTGAPSLNTFRREAVFVTIVFHLPAL